MLQDRIGQDGQRRIAGVAAPERRRDLEGLLDAGAQALLFDMGDQPADAARPIGLQFGRQLVGREMPEVEGVQAGHRSAEHTYELQSLMRKSYAGFCLKKQKK